MSLKFLLQTNLGEMWRVDEWMWLKEKQLILEVNSDERPNEERLMLYITSTELHTPVLQYGSSTFT